MRVQKKRHASFHYVKIYHYCVSHSNILAWINSLYFFIRIPYKNSEIGLYSPNFPMAPLLSMSQQLEVVEKVALKGSLWLPMAKVNLMKTSLLLGVCSRLSWPISRNKKCQSLCYGFGEECDCNNEWLILVSTTLHYIF
jgi:hypothetical protein